MKLKIKYKKKKKSQTAGYFDVIHPPKEENITTPEAKKAVKEAWARIEEKRKAKADHGVYTIVEAPCPLCGILHRLNALIKHHGEAHTICMDCALSKDLRDKLKKKGWLPSQSKRKVKRVKIKSV